MKTVLRSGEPWVWLTGGALAFALLMVVGLLGLILYNGLGFFWPADLHQFTLKDGSVTLGRITAREVIPQPDAAPGTPERHRLQVKRGNRDLYGSDFVWLNEDQVVRRERPANAVVIERREWGDFIGTITGLERAGQSGPAEPAALRAAFAEAERRLAAIHRLERAQIGRVNSEQESIRLRLKKLAFQNVTAGPEVERLRARLQELTTAYAGFMTELNAQRTAPQDYLLLAAPGQAQVRLPLTLVVRWYEPNRMGALAKVGHYFAKVWEFVSDEPRESNTEGGVWPALFGTVLMVLLMSLIVTPLGVIAAFYLREYAKQGPLVSAVRIAVNNLAGVPSIVFGVFGVGFFIYFVGGSLDALFFPERLPTPTFGTGGILWASLTLALLTVPVVIVATEEGLAAIPRGTREASLALGATKFETQWRVVLPAVTPAILTGLILAMARAAGEVAPLMITGVVKLAPALPLDGEAPFVHLDRKFMHLGFHIYDVGFQSPNVDAARPMVYTTTILLILIVLFLNLAAITIRARLRKKYTVTHL